MKEQLLETATGTWDGIRFDANYSKILTILIKEAGKCESYASDLFIDWKDIDNNLYDKELESCEYWFGFRNTGIDHKEYIETRGIENEVYMSVYKLYIVINNRHIELKLYKVGE